MGSSRARLVTCTFVCALVQSLSAGAAALKSPELDKAIAELKREYAAALKQQSGTALRKASDYFAKNAPSIPKDAVLSALEKPLAGTDGRQCAYVKWQLLSALPKDLDESDVQRLVKIYVQAPVPALRYGCSAGEKRQLDKLLPGKRLQDDVALTTTLEQAVDRAFAADLPIVSYRDEMYRRLPAGRDKFVAALQDGHARISVAGQKDKLAEALAADLANWAAQAATDRAEVREVAELLGKLRFIESPSYYSQAAVRRGKLSWVTDTDTLLTSSKFSKLHKVLLEAGGAPSLSAPAAPSKRGGNAGSGNGAAVTKDRKTGKTS